MHVLLNSAPIVGVTPGGPPAYVPGFAMAAAPAMRAQGLPGDWLQVRKDGTNLGNANVQVIDIVGDPSVIRATRGVGENSHVITIERIGSQTVVFLDTFTGAAGPIYGHTPDTAPSGFAWANNVGTDLQLDGAGNAVSPGTGVNVTAFSSGTWTAIALPSSWVYEFDTIMADGPGANDSYIDVFLANTGDSADIDLQVLLHAAGGYTVSLFGGALTGSATAAAAGAHTFRVEVSATQIAVKMDGAVLFTVSGALGMADVADVEVSMNNGDERTHKISRIMIATE